MTRHEAKQIIRQFLRSHYTTEMLEEAVRRLRRYEMPWHKPDHCVVGLFQHTQGLPVNGLYEIPGGFDTVKAYLCLAENWETEYWNHDRQRQRRLLSIVKWEIRTRRRAITQIQTAVLEKAEIGVQNG